MGRWQHSAKSTKYLPTPCPLEKESKHQKWSTSYHSVESLEVFWTKSRHVGCSWQTRRMFSLRSCSLIEICYEAYMERFCAWGKRLRKICKKGLASKCFGKKNCVRKSLCVCVKVRDSVCVYMCIWRFGYEREWESLSWFYNGKIKKVRIKPVQAQFWRDPLISLTMHKHEWKQLMSA